MQVDLVFVISLEFTFSGFGVQAPILVLIIWSILAFHVLQFCPQVGILVDIHDQIVQTMDHYCPPLFEFSATKQDFLPTLTVFSSKLCTLLPILARFVQTMYSIAQRWLPFVQIFASTM